MFQLFQLQAKRRQPNQVLTLVMVLLLIGVMTFNLSSCSAAGKVDEKEIPNAVHSVDRSNDQIRSTPQASAEQIEPSLESLLPEDIDHQPGVGLSRSFDSSNSLEEQEAIAAVTSKPAVNTETTPATLKGASLTRPTAETKSTQPTMAPTMSPTTKASVSITGFPVRNYGTLFRNEYKTKAGSIANPEGSVLVHTGNTSEGVVLVNVNVPSDAMLWKAILKGPNGTCAYELTKRRTFEGLPLQLGSGTYTLDVYEQVSDTSYATRMTYNFAVTLNSSLSPFTAASVMVDFSSSSACTTLATSLAAGKTTQTARIEAIYAWIIQNIAYDRALASSITSGAVKTYIPSPEATLKSRKGICYDYAALLAAMLRSQGIPTRLVLGQIPQGYHAWNEVYLDGTGWVQIGGQNYRQADGSTWILFDATLAASGMSSGSILNLTHNKEKVY